TRLIACSVRRIDCELGEEALARWISARDLLELDEIGAPCHGILMDPLEMWFIPEAGTPLFGRPARPSGSQRADSIDEGTPIDTGARWGRRGDQRINRIRSLPDVIQHTLRKTRPDAGNKKHQAESGHPVAWVLDEAQESEDVFDMRRVEESQATEFHERDVAAGKLHLERPTVMGCAK